MTRELTVDLGDRSYPVVLTPSLPGAALAMQLARLGLQPAARVLIVTDSNVEPLYAEDVAATITSAGAVPHVVAFPAGEASKTVATWSALIDGALAHGLRRKGDLIVALGGGVVGDVAGFAAAALHRGVDWVQVPTTLLAQVDSSVGGKTAVNHPSGKNLVGAFWQPRAVVASQRVLTTLPPREVRCGLAEAIKHGFIAAPDLLDWARTNAAALTALAPDVTAELVARCVAIKAAVVAADETEAGWRAVLNLGHTFGHAFERELGYGALTHGEAVALGLVMAIDVSIALGVCEDPELRHQSTELLTALKLPSDPYRADLPDLDRLVDAARGDKKAVGRDAVRFILLRRAGAPLIQVHPWEHLRGALAPEFSSRRPK